MQLRLSWSVIISGIRVAVLIVISIAVVAAIINGPGFGKPLQDGLARLGAINSFNEVITGALGCLLVAAGYEKYQNRDDGFPGLQRTYGFEVPAGRLKVLQAGPIYQATADQKECLFGEVYTTDGRIPELGLTVLAR